MTKSCTCQHCAAMWKTRARARAHDGHSRVNTMRTLGTNDGKTARNFQHRAALELEPVNTPSAPLYVSVPQVRECDAVVLLSPAHRLKNMLHERAA